MPWPDVLAAVFPTPWHFVAVCVALAVAETTYVLLGFGAGLVAVGTLALVMPEIRDVVVLVLLVNLPAELFVVWTSRRHIEWRGIALLLVGIVVGIPVGGAILKLGEPSFLLAVLGAVLIAVGGIFLCLRDGLKWRLPAWSNPATGLISGMLTGLFGTGGPPLVLHYRLLGLDKAAFRGNLMALFLIMTAVRLPSYAALGLITGPRLAASLAVMPAVLAGAVVGHRIHLDLSESTFRRVVSAALVVVGGLLLVRLL
jgi:uncharacterized membrane protein YfcA